jgi:DNA-binding MarR family transcriptional regulator
MKPLLHKPHMTPRQIYILGRLFIENAALSNGRLIEEMKVDEAVMTNNTKALAKKGYIIKARSAQNDRKVLLSITDLGTTLIREMGVL